MRTSKAHANDESRTEARRIRRTSHADSRMQMRITNSSAVNIVSIDARSVHARIKAIRVPIIA